MNAAPNGVKLSGMNALAAPAYISEEQYRDGEEFASQKHEWLGGEVFPMPGGTDNHTVIIGNLYHEIRLALRGNSHKARNSEKQVKVESSGLETYPDAVIFEPPGRFAGRGNQILLTPKVIFEVLSPGTESYDRQGKFGQYKRIETLSDYVLVAQDSICVEHFHRRGDDWLYRSFITRADSLTLESVGVTLPLDGIYEDLDLPEPLLVLPASANDNDAD